MRAAPAARMRSAISGGQELRKMTFPPLVFKAAARARQRMTWPVPISGEASARMTIVSFISP
jgi:hypothetical protein